MDDLNQRQKSILRMLIRDYIDRVKPIGSSWLVRRHKMGCCSATVRNDLAWIEELGLIAQPHFSSGRMPTEKGYRYYIDYLMDKEEIPVRFKRRIITAVRTLGTNRYSDAVRVLADEVSSMIGNMTVVSVPNARLHLSGLRFVLAHPEFIDNKKVRNFGILLDNIDQIFAEIRENMKENDFEIFLGGDLDYDFANSLAIVVKKFRDPFGENHLFATIGPVRMNYRVLPDLMEFASKTLEEF